MSQHDYDVANATGPNARADINAVLGAIRSLNSGATEPASMVALMLWADTSEYYPVLKIRNLANTAWITLPFALYESDATNGALKVNGFFQAVGEFMFGVPATGWGLNPRVEDGGDFLQITQAESGTYDMSKGITLRRTTGRVGIGVNDPGEMLSVSGKIQSLDVTEAVQGGFVFPDATEQNTAGSIVRVHHAEKTDTFQTTNATWTDVTGLSVTLTPASVDSVFDISVVLQACSSPAVYSPGFFRVVRDTTPLSVGGSADNRTNCSGMIPSTDAGTFEDRQIYSNAANAIDEPATVSSITYKVQVRNSGGGYIYVNRTALNDDAVYCGVAASSLIVREIIPGVI